jgi:signal transduction histidine kinase
MTTAQGELDRRGAWRGVLAALKDPFTYDLRKNVFTLIGILWGLPLSFFAIAIDLWVIGHPQRLALFWEQPSHLVLFLLQPFLFGIVMGAMGTSHEAQDRKIRELLSEQQKHLDDLASANVELRKLDEMKTQFMANVTHELKTPLVAIKGYNQSILEGRFGPLTPKQEKGLSIAVRNVGRLEKLIHQLLEFERLESHAYTPVPSDFDLVPLVHLVLSNFQPEIDEKKLSADLELPGSLEVKADYEGIRRVLLNLISNAVKFSSEGGMFGVETEIPPGSARAWVTVWDLGPGIPPEAKPFLFTRFWQADGSSRRRHGGTGLGLAIVKGILDAHGLGVRAESTPGIGTKIRFELPLTVASSLQEVTAHADEKAAHPDR